MELHESIIQNGAHHCDPDSFLSGWRLSAWVGDVCGAVVPWSGAVVILVGNCQVVLCGAK